MKLTPNQYLILCSTPPSRDKGCSAKHISNAKTELDEMRARMHLEDLHKLGYVKLPINILGIYKRGYRRTKAGDVLILQLDWDAA